MKRIALAAIGLLVAASAAAQDWPMKPVRFINPFPAGGGTDTFARPLSAVLTKSLSQSFIVENQGGAGGTVGAANAARAAGDGYTFFIGAVHHTIAPSVYPKLTYDIEKDFLPVTLLATVPNVLVLNHKTDFKTMKEFEAYVKQNPGRLNYGSPGTGTSQHLAAELWKLSTKTFMVHIPYRGAGPAVQDFLAGNFEVMFDGLGASAAQIRAGRIRGIGMMSPKRHPQFPDIPTMAEQGYPGMEVSTWYGIWGIKGTPQPIMDRMYQEVIKAWQDPTIKKVWEVTGADFGGQKPDEFARYIRSEIVRWAKVVKDAGIKLD
ncbi:MAG: tripartite tricarboxylate transporter substrate binding protein [Betaproteobacteria bacterium]|nr:tripartite tricarboxylate transporter substrate binding protein [Betaproteobacteria bacterium]